MANNINVNQNQIPDFTQFWVKHIQNRTEIHQNLQCAVHSEFRGPKMSSDNRGQKRIYIRLQYRLPVYL